MPQTMSLPGMVWNFCEDGAESDLASAHDWCSVHIPVKWAPDSGDVGRRRSEATLVAFYSSEVAHMSQEKGK